MSLFNFFKKEPAEKIETWPSLEWQLDGFLKSILLNLSEIRKLESLGDSITMIEIKKLQRHKKLLALEEKAFNKFEQDFLEKNGESWWDIL